MGYHFLLQVILLTQESKPHLLCLLHWQLSSLPLSHLGSPYRPIPLTNTNHVKYIPKQVSLHNDPWVCNRFVTRNERESVQMKNTLNTSFVSVLPSSKNISRSQFLVSNSHHYREGTERLLLLLSLRMWCRPAAVPTVTNTNSRT